MTRTRFDSAWWSEHAYMVGGAFLCISITTTVVKGSTAILASLGTAARHIGKTLGAEPTDGWLGPLFMTTGLIGLLSMASIQTARALFSWRGFFHRARVRDWLAAKREPRLDGSRLVEPDEALEGLVKLTGTERHLDFFDLPIEQLCGQISASAERLLEYPGKGELLYSLAGTTGQRAVQKYMEALGKTAPGAGMAKTDAPDDDLIDSRNALAHHIQRRIDGLQVRAGAQWRRTMLVTAILSSAVFALALVWDLPAVDALDKAKKLGISVVLGLFGGFMATVMRDVVAVIEKLRR